MNLFRNLHNRMHIKREDKRSVSGFTLAEVLIVVGILLLLLALIIPAVLHYQRVLKQKGLDEKAQIIYTAAQNQLALLELGHKQDLYNENAEGVNSTGYINGNHPSDWMGTGTFPDLYYISYADKGKTAVDAIMGANAFDSTVENELYNSRWIIEYNPKNATVYGVFYNESEDMLQDYGANQGYYNTLRGFDTTVRIHEGVKVGYYGGDILSTDAGMKFTPNITIVNEEILYAQISCYSDVDIYYEITLSDTEGNSYTETVQPKDIASKLNRYTLILDDLGSTFTRFNSLYGEDSGHGADCLVSGTDITVSVIAHARNNTIDAISKSIEVSETANSLFANRAHYSEVMQDEVDEDTAVIQYCRHLQNLDKSSGVHDGITKAIQINGLDFGATRPTGSNESVTKYFLTTYSDKEHHGDSQLFTSAEHRFGAGFATHTDEYYNGTVLRNGSRVPNFKPINNENLSSYTGSYINKTGTEVYSHSISNLTVVAGTGAANPATSAGLFEILKAPDNGTFTFAIKGVEMIDAAITTLSLTGSAGGLVGEIGTGTTVNLDRVRSRLSNDGHTGKSENNIWIYGVNAGGLVGKNSGSLSFEYSYGATVAGKGNQSAAPIAKTGAPINTMSMSVGGLVGTNNGTVNINKSFADNYLAGKQTGGFIGKSSGEVNIESSYAAGFAYGFDTEENIALENITSSKNCMAGMVVGNVNRLGNSYTILAPIDGKKATNYRRYVLSTALNVNSASNVYYLISTMKLDDAAQGGEEDPQTTSIDGHTGTSSILSLSISELKTALGGNFTLNFSDTEAYRLMGQSITAYPYPRLADPDGQESFMAHRNDWKEEFTDGTLVYYEKYSVTFAELNQWMADHPGYTETELEAYLNSSVSYGFSGGSISALTNDRVVRGDGYGIVYLKKSFDDVNSLANIPSQITVTLKDGDTQVVSENVLIKTSNAKFYPVDVAEASSGTPAITSYRIFPLSENIVNRQEVSANYYQHITVKPLETGAGTESYYYGNFHMAESVVPVLSDTATMPVFTNGSIISVRTPRQLFRLTTDYAIYQAKTGTAIFKQSRDIDYKYYDWTGFHTNTYVNSTESTPKPVTILEQKPIGAGDNTAEKPFIATYDGGCFEIRNVNFKATATSDYTGLFGINRGTIKNVFLPADFNVSGQGNRYAVVNKDSSSSVNVGMGTLAGFNDTNGYIDNCASAGIVLGTSEGLISAYSGNIIYVGGLVGVNRGIIANSSADTPLYRMNMTDAQVYAGGFAGYNTGRIVNSYALGAIITVSSTRGDMRLGGFAGYNTGNIDSSYAATALRGGGTAKVYAFTNTGGTVSNSRYLDGSTLKYVNTLYSYNYTAGTSAGSAITRENLVNSGNNAVKSYYHKYSTSNGGAYPYRAVVKNNAGAFVHYGEWQNDGIMGELGIFYWEKEESGTNDGYHYTYIGTKEGGYVSGTSLCTAHDDNGVITEYGYGYYVKKGEEGNIEIANSALNGASGIRISGNTVNTGAKAALEAQLKEYTVYPYTTRETAGTGDYIVLTAEPAAADRNCPLDGTLSVTYPKTGTDRTTYNFTISPFFANAMSFDSFAVNGGAATSINTDIIVTSSDYSNTNYSKKPGINTDNKYDIRSIKQLQFINWNYATKDCNQLVTESNYRQFTYLLQTSITGIGTESRGTALNNQNKYWQQTHDLEGRGVTGYTPIAAPATSSPANISADENIRTNQQYSSVLYSWFGDSYDGQSYKIERLNIESKAFAVGLFGITAGANLENIILDGNGSSIIQRNATASDADGAYALGGLAGVAYDYKNAISAIRNCAISGYTIQDNSRNKLTLGEANVGGLIGIANVNLSKCSSVVDIALNCVHKIGAPRGEGNFVRCGMLTGANKGTVADCYTGGNITVGTETLEQAYKSEAIHISTTTNDWAERKITTHIFIGGISGSAFASTYKNFEGTEMRQEGAPVFKNCYTYASFPKLEGTIRSISLIGSVADGFSGGIRPKYYNCFYLESSKDIELKMPAYRISNGVTVSDDTMQNRVNEMLMGNLNYMMDYHWDITSSQTPYTNQNYQGVTSLTYAQMASRNGGQSIAVTKNPLDAADTYTSDAVRGVTFDDFASAISLDTESGSYRGTTATLGSGNIKTSSEVWNYVTIKENGRDIDGKYSFPGDSSPLNGSNYPFAAVVKQKDILSNSSTRDYTIYVHYGVWGNADTYWGRAMETMDLFEDMVMDGSAEDGFSVKTFTLTLPATAPDLEITDVTISDPSIAKVISLARNVDKTQIKVKIKALKRGTVNITAMGATFNLNIGADIRANVPNRLTYLATELSSSTTKTLTPLKAENKQTLPVALRKNNTIWKLLERNSSDLTFVNRMATGTDEWWESDITLNSTKAGTSRTVDAEATYYYPAKPADGEATVNIGGETYNCESYTSNVKEIEVVSYGFVGIATKEGGEVHSTALMPRKDREYTTTYTRGNTSNLRLNSSLSNNDFYNNAIPFVEVTAIGAEDGFYIYGTKGDKALNDTDVIGNPLVTLDNITIVIDGNTVVFTRQTDGTYAEEGTSYGYALDIGALQETDDTNNYQYYRCSISESGVEVAYNRVSSFALKVTDKRF